MGTIAEHSKSLAEVVGQHRLLYADPSLKEKLKLIIGTSPHSSFSEQNIWHILCDSRSVFFDTHIEVVSGHHTGSYLRFESIAANPGLVQMIAKDMARWISCLNKDHQVNGIIAPASDARLLAEHIALYLKPSIPLRVVLAPFDPTTGRIGTEVPPDTIGPQDHFLALNDITTRGNCVSKLKQIVIDQGGSVAGMMVFVRRDSGQFPFMNELSERFPFYYGASLHMPQWEASHCRLCQAGDTLFSWRDMPSLESET